VAKATEEAFLEPSTTTKPVLNRISDGVNMVWLNTLELHRANGRDHILVWFTPDVTRFRIGLFHMLLHQEIGKNF
tara:strand:+ start:144 stop:368 length:225 start_codon:yes stop_codon:yes gene_type:complete